MVYKKRIMHTLESVKLYCENLGYDLLDDEYKNNLIKLTLRDKEGYLYSISFGNLTQGKHPYKFNKYNPYTIQNINHYIDLNVNGYELLSTEYRNCDEKLLFRCPKNHEFKTSWDDFSQGCRCPYCSNYPRKIELGINTIWDTDRWMCDLGVSEEDAKRYSHSSGKKIKVKCPNCGKEKYMVLNKIYTRKSISCICKSKISYPEKFMVELLDQLNLKYIKEYTPKWSNYRRYDFYLPDHNIIIETHGKQHYTQYGFKSLGGKTLEEEQKNDEYKKTLALENKINDYIVIDCRKSKLEWIKENILNSELSDILNLDDIDWSKCEQKALENPIIINKDERKVI